MVWWALGFPGQGLEVQGVGAMVRMQGFGVQIRVKATLRAYA